MRAVLKIVDLSPYVENDGVVTALLYKQEEKWGEVEVGEGLESLLSVAGNTISSNPPQLNVLRFVEVEAPGMKVTIGEGSVEGVETVISPIPAYLRSIKFVKVEGENPVVVHEFKPGNPSIVYDSSIAFGKKLEYDLILVETSEGVRIVFPHELLLEKVKTETKKRRKRRKARRSKKSKAEKKKKRRSGKKRRRARR